MLENRYITNLLQEFGEYIEELAPKKAANAKTALYRYYGAGLSGQKTKKIRFDQRAINKAEKLLRGVIVDENFKIEDHLEVFEKGREILGIEATKTRAAKSYLKAFLEYVSNKFNKESKKVIVEERRERELLGRKILDKKYINDKLKSESRKQKETIALSKKPEFYINRLKEKYKDKSELELEKIVEENIKRLEKEEESYIDYWRNENLKDVTIKTNLIRVQRLLGWEYRYENKELTIEDLSLMILIPVVKIKAYEIKDREKRFIKEGELLEKAKEESKYLLKKVDKFLKDYKVNQIGAVESYIKALVSLAKFIYRDITDIDEADNYEDILVIRQLRVKLRKFKEIMPTPKRKLLPLTWEEVKAVVESYRIDATKDNYEWKNGNKIQFPKKPINVQAQHLQRFLVLGFFTIIPPDRQRTIRELSYGGTLKYGKQDNAGYLIPLEPDKDINNEGRYFIDLKTEDYKTGKTYGDFIMAIPDKKYEDGNTFYGYLNKWLFEGYRNELAKEEVKTVFVSPVSGESMDTNSMTQYVNNKFLARTGVRLSPHKLRNIFVTHINNEGLSDIERKSIAYAMKHDLTTAEKVYNNQTSQERLKPAMDYLKNS